MKAYKLYADNLILIKREDFEDILFLLSKKSVMKLIKEVDKTKAKEEIIEEYLDEIEEEL